MRRTSWCTTSRRRSTTRSESVGAVAGWLVNTCSPRWSAWSWAPIVVAVMHVLPFGHGKGQTQGHDADATTEGHAGPSRILRIGEAGSSF